jgi:ketosteroid isomerase-like protein
MKTITILFLGLIVLSFTQKKQPEDILNTFMDTWHEAAAKADTKAYFDAMSDDFIFLGTDPKERWDKKTFYDFCKPYFDQGKGWDFKRIERHWDFSDNGKIAWFDERIDTWMKDCRGSGVLVKKGGKWYLKQYNLAVLIENEKIQSFIELRNKK